MQILVIGMLDEREEGLSLIKERIERRGHTPIIADVSIGTGALAPAIKPDITPEEIARAGGSDLNTIRGMLAKERDKAISTMAEGTAKKAVALYADGRLHGVIAVAGMTGTFLSLTVMRALPFGLPKVLISSVAAMPAYAARRRQTPPTSPSPLPAPTTAPASGPPTSPARSTVGVSSA